MKKSIFSAALAVLLAIGAQAQKPAFESATQTFGYKNEDGTWKLMPQYQRAGEFEGKVRRWAPVKVDG